MPNTLLVVPLKLWLPMVQLHDTQQGANNIHVLIDTTVQYVVCKQKFTCRLVTSTNLHVHGMF